MSIVYTTWKDQFHGSVETITDATVEDYIRDQRTYPLEQRFRWNILQVVHEDEEGKSCLWEFDAMNLRNEKIIEIPDGTVQVVDSNYIRLFFENDDNYAIDIARLRRTKDLSMACVNSLFAVYPQNLNGELIIHTFNSEEYISRIKNHNITYNNHGDKIKIEQWGDADIYRFSGSQHNSFFVLGNHRDNGEGTRLTFVSREAPYQQMILDDSENKIIYPHDDTYLEFNPINNNILLIMTTSPCYVLTPTFGDEEHSEFNVRAYDHHMFNREKSLPSKSTISQKFIGGSFSSVNCGPTYIVDLQQLTQYFIVIIDCLLRKAYHIPIWTESKNIIPDGEHPHLEVKLYMIENPQYLRDIYIQKLSPIPFPHDITNSILSFLL